MRKTRKKAVSPVIATLLLILIAVAAAILVYVWVTGYTSSMTKTGTPELEEKIKVEAVGVSSTDKKTVTVYFRNIGDVQAVIDTIYIINATDGSILSSTVLSTKITLTPGELGTATVTSGTALSAGQTYIVKVVTTNGVEASLSFTVRA